MKASPVARFRTLAALLLALAPACAMAQDATLRVLTNAHDSVVRALADAFAEAEGVKIEPVRVEAFGGDVDGALLEAAQNGRIDVVLLAAAPEAERLAEAGALVAHDGSLAAAWPDFLKDDEGKWFAFGERSRVLIFRKDNPLTIDVTQSRPPLHIRDLWNPVFSKGALVLSQPDQGSMRVELAAMRAMWGEIEYDRWVGQMERQRARWIADESEIPQIVIDKRASAGVCDSHIAFEAIANGAELEVIPLEHTKFNVRGMIVEEIGPLFVAHTVGVTTRGADNEHAGAFVEFALSEKVDRLLAEIDASHIPIYQPVREDHPELIPVKQPAAVTIEEILLFEDDAMSTFRKFLPG